jgi:hypothetical protein
VSRELPTFLSLAALPIGSILTNQAKAKGASDGIADAELNQLSGG